MSGIIGILNELYIRFMVWLGAAPPTGYEHLIRDETRPQEYTLKEGDTLFSVARKFGTHYERIAKANSIEDPENLQPGQTLIIPPANWDPASGPLTQLQPPPEPAPEPSLPPTAPEEELTEEPVPPTPPIAPEELAEELAPGEELPEEPEWLTEAEPVAEPVFPPEKPAWPSEEPEPTEEPEWLIATEPVPEVETVDDRLAAAESTLEPDEPEWLLATEAEFEAEPTIPTQPMIEAFAPAPYEAPAEVEPVAEEEEEPARLVSEEMVFRYTVQRGDTISSIARRYGVTVKELVEANDIVNPNLIFPGQKLIIPGYMLPKPEPEPEPTPTPKPEPDKFFVYTVVRGDTLSAIAKRYGVTIRQLIETNNIEDPNLIRVGQQLVIPGVSEPPEPEPEPIPPPTFGIDPNFPPLGPMDAIRGLYVSYFAIGHAQFRQRIFELLDTTEFNAVVVDVKGDHGWISYPSQIPLAYEIGAARPTARDFEQVMAQFKSRGVYTIARIVTFKDNPLATNYPEYAVKTSSPNGTTEIWQDREQLSWTDPFLKPVWDYNIQVAVEAAQMGFDEIQFDYVRFPTPSQAGVPQFSQEVTKETRIAAITGFLSAARGQLKPFGVKVAADTFGYTCWRKDDTLIGQDIDQMGQYLDVLSPMLYPSTFGSGIPGYKFAVAHPYEIVHQSAQRALNRVTQFNCTVRPWIQDFPDYRFDKRVYGKEEIQAQIKGCFDAGGSGFMVWDPRVKYTDGAYAPVTGHP